MAFRTRTRQHCLFVDTRLNFRSGVATLGVAMHFSVAVLKTAASGRVLAMRDRHRVGVRRRWLVPALEAHCEPGACAGRAVCSHWSSP
jgi:hypothetical protein